VEELAALGDGGDHRAGRGAVISGGGQPCSYIPPHQRDIDTEQGTGNAGHRIHNPEHQRHENPKSKETTPTYASTPSP
jgi:hypothetical protein